MLFTAVFCSKNTYILSLLPVELIQYYCCSHTEEDETKKPESNMRHCSCTYISAYNCDSCSRCVFQWVVDVQNKKVVLLNVAFNIYVYNHSFVHIIWGGGKFKMTAIQRRACCIKNHCNISCDCNENKLLYCKLTSFN